ncbi:MAG: hypothetical protein WC895_02890 [Candidatus Shapirobacteria bacterium]
MKSGKHLAVVRTWLQWNAANGDNLEWGSKEPLVLKTPLTPYILEELAQSVRNVVEEDLLRKNAAHPLIVMCGSSRYVDIMAVCAWLLERDEGVITTGLHLLPPWYPTACADHLAEAENCSMQMDNLHLRKIDRAEGVFVVDVQHYIGESTKREVEYAQKQGKPIRWFTEDPIGKKVQAMIDDVLRKAGLEEKPS